MSLAKKLNLAGDTKVRVIGKPPTVDLGDVAVTSSPKAAAVLVFVQSRADVGTKCGPAIDAARRDDIAWVAYPKGGQLGTDLNRDVLWQDLLTHGIAGVRQIAIDAVWSAIRFRPR